MNTTFDDMKTDFQEKKYSFMMQPEHKAKLFENDAKNKVRKQLSNIKKKEMAEHIGLLEKKSRPMSGSSVNSLNRFNQVAPIKVTKQPKGSFIYAKNMNCSTIIKDIEDVEEEKFRGSTVQMDQNFYVRPRKIKSFDQRSRYR